MRGAPKEGFTRRRTTLPRQTTKTHSPKDAEDREGVQLWGITQVGKGCCRATARASDRGVNVSIPRQLPDRRYRSLADLEDGLCFQERRLFGERVKGVNMEFVISCVKVQERKWRNPLIGPLLERNVEASILSKMDVISMCSWKKLWCHFFNLG